MLTPFDQVFVVNHYSCSTQLFRCNMLKSANSILILSSNALFESEKSDILRQLSPAKVVFKQFDSWNKDIEQEMLDESAFDKVKHWLKYTSIYQREFLDEVTFLKNKYVHKKLIQEHSINSSTKFTVLCQTFDLMNLGISFKFWKSKGARIVNCGPLNQYYLLLKRISSIMVVRCIIYIAKAAVFSIIPIKVLSITDGDLFFLISQKRIEVKQELQGRYKWLIPITTNWSKGKIACPIHSSSKMNSMYPFVRRDKMVLIQDAFRPTSYPPYYYALSFYGSSLIPKSKIDEKFFSDAGIDCYPLGTVVTRQVFRIKDDNSFKTVRNVCLTLNHAGNWSSLISRADTDGLIIEFVQMSKKYEEINFIVRLHPNSNSLKGEGLGWTQRIQKIIRLNNLSNLELSNRTLEEDWAKADLFISEYSLSAVEALRLGKYVMFINLTKRRSFVRDLTEIGFLEVKSVDEFDELLNRIIKFPKKYYVDLSKAIANYNANYSPPSPNTL